MGELSQPPHRFIVLNLFPRHRFMPLFVLSLLFLILFESIEGSPSSLFAGKKFVFKLFDSVSRFRVFLRHFLVELLELTIPLFDLIAQDLDPSHRLR